MYKEDSCFRFRLYQKIIDNLLILLASAHLRCEPTVNQKELNKVFPLTDSSRKVPCIAKLDQERKSDGNLAKNPPKLCIVSNNEKKYIYTCTRREAVENYRISEDRFCDETIIQNVSSILMFT